MVLCGDRASSLAPGARRRPAVNPRPRRQGFSDRVNAYVALQKRWRTGCRSRLRNNETPRRSTRISRAGRPSGWPERRQSPAISSSATPAADSAKSSAGCEPRVPSRQRAPNGGSPGQPTASVNTAYPEKAALATVPPLILDQLPRYRRARVPLHGRDLILRDTNANLIVDFIDEAVPDCGNTMVHFIYARPLRSSRAPSLRGAPVSASVAAPPAAQASQRRRRRRRRRPELPNSRDSVKFAVIGDNGTGEQPQYEVGRQMASLPRQFPFDFVIMLGDNLYGSQNAAGLRDQVRGPVQAAARRGREVLRVARQPRQPEATASTSRATWAASATTRSRRTTSASSCSTPTTSIRSSATGSSSELQELDRRLEDRLLPSPALLIGAPPRLADRPARRPRAAVREVRRQRRVRRPRPLLRADQAAAGHLLLRRGIGRPAAPGRPAEDRLDRGRLRPAISRS